VINCVINCLPNQNTLKRMVYLITFVTPVITILFTVSLSGGLSTRFRSILKHERYKMQFKNGTVKYIITFFDI